MTMPSLRSLLAVLLAAFASLAAAPAAHAASSMESIFQDDAVLLNSNDVNVVRAGLDEMKGLGVDTVHSLFVWAQIAPQRQDTKRPGGFDPSEPSAYPAENWRKYDTLVRGAASRGIDLIVTPTNPAPAWAGDCKTADQRRLCVNRPSPKEYRSFIAALAKRYSGSFPDPDDSSKTLPRVRRWSFMNEPNLGAWLTPQFEKVKGRTVASGVRIYRRLAYAGIDAVRGSPGHSGDALYIAETAPVGGAGSTLAEAKNPPRSFLRGLFCLDSRGRPLRDAAIGCGKRFRRFPVSGITHHPYTFGAGAPPFTRSGANDITIGFIPRLTGLLRQAARAKRIPRPAAKRILFTEFGYQTNPPDSNFGVSWAKQAEYLNLAEYLSYTTKEVRGVSQYELYDDPSTSSFNTGLRTCRAPCSEEKKASYAAYRLPLYVVRTGPKRVRLFGWVRPGVGAQTVEIHLITGTGKAERDVRLKAVKTRTTGILDVTLPRRTGEYQLRWTSAGETYLSRRARIALR
jgi:hypothetical protein